jgi:hypothetical protein
MKCKITYQPCSKDSIHITKLLIYKSLKNYYFYTFKTSMPRNFYLSFVTLLCIWNSALAQTKKTPAAAPKQYTFEEIKSYNKLLYKIPVNRQYLHGNISAQLKRIDNLDGRADGKLHGFRGEAIDNEITNELILAATHLTYFIENVNWDLDDKIDHNYKLSYLKQLNDNLKMFGDVARSGKFEMDNFRNMVGAQKGIIIAKHTNTLPAFIKENADMGIFLNRGLFGADSTLHDIIINEMCFKNPKYFANKLTEIVKYENAPYVITYLAKQNPLDVLKYATSTTSVGKMIKMSEDPYIKAIYILGNNVKNSSRALNYLDSYVEGKMTIADIKKITENEESYFKSLVVLKQKNITNSSRLVERDLKTAVSEYVRIINELHDKSPEVRFKSISNMDEKDLYYLIIYGGDEIYTSSFLGVFNKVIKKIDATDGFDYLNNLQKDNFRTFVRMCANYNTLEPFLATMSATKRNELMREFVSNLGEKKEVNLDGATEVADAFGSINDKELVLFLLNEIEMQLTKYTNEKNKNASKVYAILKSLLGSKTEVVNGENNADALSTNLNIPPINYLPFAELIDSNKNSITEQMFFYGDDDGKGWFNRFITSMRSNKNWKVDESNANWVLCTAKNSKVPFYLYANKPLTEPDDEKAQSKLAEYLVMNEMVPSIIVHRGHSYHLKHTMESIFELNKIIILGSCGGYHNLGEILQRSPDGHITSSKQVGKGNINSKIIDEVNATIINGSDIVWPAIWKKLDGTMAADDKSEWNDYVFPHKNLGALFLKAYNRITVSP